MTDAANTDVNFGSLVGLRSAPSEKVDGVWVKVLQVLPTIASDSGGPVRSTLANCRAVHAINRNVVSTLATTGKNLDPAWVNTFADRMPRRMTLKIFRSVGSGAFIFSPSLGAWILRNVTKYDLVVVRGMFSPVSALATWVAQFRGMPYILVPHGTLSPYTFRYRRSLLKRAHFFSVGRRMLTKAAGIRFTSEEERKEAPAWGDATRVWVIPHPYEPVFSLDDSRSEDARQVLFLSRFHSVKGVDVLLEAVSYARTQMPNIRLVLAGSGNKSYEEHVRSTINELDLADAVELPGFVGGEQKRSLLSESAVFVLPSQQENFGIAVVEAMDAGIPVVISRGVDIWKRVEEAEAGIVVENRKPEEVAEAIVTLLRDSELRRRMGGNGRQLVRSSFDPESVGRRVVEMYRTAAGSR